MQGFNATGRRMTSGEDHVVPLRAQALAIVRQASDINGNGPLLFPKLSTGRAMSENRFLNARTAIGYRDDCSPHGFRSSFRHWVAEETEYQSEVAEKALAHAIKSDVEATSRQAGRQASPDDGRLGRVRGAGRRQADLRGITATVEAQSWRESSSFFLPPIERSRRQQYLQQRTRRA